MRQSMLALVVAAALAAAGSAAAQTPSESDKPKGVNDDVIQTSEGFLGAHPDMRWRLEGLEAMRRGRHADALEFFTRAARYADKPSQGMLGEMYWSGNGVAIDRPLAYAWMDLAAERGYPFLLAKRESYWKELTAEERERAVAIGTPMYDEYGDTAAKPRLERILRRERRNTTGSRVGSVGNLQILIPTPGGTRTIDGTQYWADKFWEPELYWRWQDYDWRKPGVGTVEVGEVMTDVNDPALEGDDEDESADD